MTSSVLAPVQFRIVPVDDTGAEVICTETGDVVFAGSKAEAFAFVGRELGLPGHVSSRSAPSEVRS